VNRKGRIRNPHHRYALAVRLGRRAPGSIINMALKLSERWFGFRRITVAINLGFARLLTGNATQAVVTISWSI
jgi:hypothetical protein